MRNKSDKKRRSRRTRRIILFSILGVIAIVAGCMSAGNRKAPLNMSGIPVEIRETDETTTKVALVQSSKESVFDLTEADVETMVREAVNLAGGLEGIVKDGDTVVLKPNFMAVNPMSGSFFSLLRSMRTMNENPHPEETLVSREANGITTDYRVAKAVVELVREINPSGRVLIMEGSGSGYTAAKMELLGYTYEMMPGVDAFIPLDDTGVDYATGDTDDLVAVDLGSKRLYEEHRNTAHTNGLYYFNKTYYEADVIIDLPVLKNHQMAAVTGAIKNVAIGSTPPRIYGGDSGNRGAINHSWEPLNNWIHDYYLARPVDFVVTDGLQALQNGPMAAGFDTLEEGHMNMRLIMAGRDALAVDTIHALITGVDPEQVDYFIALAEDGIGIMDSAKIDIVGNVRVDQVKESFSFPGFPYTMMNPQPRRRVYEDFDAPQIIVEQAELNQGRLTAEITSDEELVKLEIYSGDTCIDTIQTSGSDIEVNLANDAFKGISNLEIYAYDKYLNCSVKTIDI